MRFCVLYFIWIMLISIVVSIVCLISEWKFLLLIIDGTMVGHPDLLESSHWKDLTLATYGAITELNQGWLSLELV